VRNHCGGRARAAATRQATDRIVEVLTAERHVRLQLVDRLAAVLAVRLASAAWFS
jgi:hypothetical protein